MLPAYWSCKYLTFNQAQTFPLQSLYMDWCHPRGMWQCYTVCCYDKSSISNSLWTHNTVLFSNLFASHWPAPFPVPHSSDLNLNHYHFPLFFSPIKGPSLRTEKIKVMTAPSPSSIWAQHTAASLPFTLRSSTAIGRNQPFLLCSKYIDIKLTCIPLCPSTTPFLYFSSLLILKFLAL